MIGRVLLLALCGTILAPASERADSKAIRRAGEHSLYGGELVIQVTNKDSFVGYQIAQRRGGRVTLSPTRIKEGSGWFLYPVSADVVWIYEGGDFLQSVHFGDGATTVRGGQVDGEAVWREYLKRVPKAVVAELPAKLRTLQRPKE